MKINMESNINYCVALGQNRNRSTPFTNTYINVTRYKYKKEDVSSNKKNIIISAGFL